jgi:hypothetical protein
MKFILPFLMLFTISVAAQSDKIVKWSATATKIKNNEYKLELKAQIQDGYYIYSQFLENDNGPVRTGFSIEQTEIEAQKATETGKKKEGFDDIFGMNLIKYSHEMVITQIISSKKTLTTLSGFIDFMTCNNELCYPPASVYYTADIK